jgi:hypothetical protein
LLVTVGLYIRRRPTETPEFVALGANRGAVRTPFLDMLKDHGAFMFVVRTDAALIFEVVMSYDGEIAATFVLISPGPGQSENQTSSTGWQAVVSALHAFRLEAA